MTITVSLPKQLPKVKRPGWLRLPKVGRAGVEIASQATGVLSVLVGVSMWSVPCAFILGGLTVIFAIERQV